MVDIVKPDISSVWAEAGAVIAPSNEKIKLGWTSEVPPHQYENFVQNRQDEMLAYLNQKGVPEWRTGTEYFLGKSFVQDAGKIYKANKNSGGLLPNQKPSTDATNEYWEQATFSLSDLKQAVGTSTKDVMSQKATSDAIALKVDSTRVKQVTGVSTTDIMSQKAVTDALGEVTEALSEVQVQGAASWSTDGAPYPINAQTYHNGKQWLALRPNSVAPVEGEDWTELVGKQYVDEATDRIGLIDYAYVAKSYHIVAFGGEFNRADYPKLWAYLQANPSLVKTEAQWTAESTANGGICGFFSDGDGTTTFRVPNLDKAFLRPDSRTIGSYQGDDFKSHTHISGYADDLFAVGKSHDWPFNLTGSENHNYSIYTSSTGGTETRPRNIAVLPLIVAK